MQPVQEYYSDFISPSCGKACLSGIALGNLSVDISTGFELNAGDAAIFYYGNVCLSDAGGTSHQDFGPSGLAERRSWSSHRTVGGLSPSNGRAWIDSSSSLRRPHRRRLLLPRAGHRLLRHQFAAAPGGW
ncbi:hypothetical protein ACFRKE_00895 [Kitasatospora indigofera]|uniref:hypothetical protein n=1 Tax=Kitasatospora indigofera TaxID=67307 RepID=UPI0036CAC35C